MSASKLPMVITSRKPWNHGRIIRQNRPLLPKHVWAIRVRLRLAEPRVVLDCSTWRSIASSEGAISFGLRRLMSMRPGCQRARIHLEEQNEHTGEV